MKMARQVIVVALIFTAVVGALAADTKAPASSPSTVPVVSPSTAPTSSPSPSDGPASEIGIEVPNPGGEQEVDDNADYGGVDAPTPGPEAAEGPDPPADVVA